MASELQVAGGPRPCSCHKCCPSASLLLPPTVGNCEAQHPGSVIVTLLRPHPPCGLSLGSLALMALASRVTFMDAPCQLSLQGPNSGDPLHWSSVGQVPRGGAPGSTWPLEVTRPQLSLLFPAPPSGDPSGHTPPATCQSVACLRCLTKCPKPSSSQKTFVFSQGRLAPCPQLCSTVLRLRLCPSFRVRT